MSALGIAERRNRDETTNLARIVVRDRGLEVLALRCRLPELPSQPTQQAHCRLIRHAAQAIEA